MKTAALITHSHPPAATEAVAVAAAVAREAGWRLVADRGRARQARRRRRGHRGRRRATPRPDLCLVLGGDGSILHALRRFARTGVPVFGVNFGTVGFLAAVERDEADAGIAPRPRRRDRDDRAARRSRSRLDGEAAIGLNDVTLTRRPHDRVAELSYRIAGEEVGHVRCDGLVAATPVGSTGYNLANQGPILAWGVKGYVVSYIAPALADRAGPGRRPRRRPPRRQRAGREPVEVAVDGDQFGRRSPPATTLEVRFVDSVGRLAQLPGTSFYQRIREKFGHLAV